MSSGRVNDQLNNDKREIIKHQLETNFPTKITITTGLVLILIGLAGIGLQIGLIVNNGVHYEYGNGIWGGFFALVNGLIRLNMVRRTYGSYIVYKSFGFIFNISGAIGLSVLSLVNLRSYSNCSTAQCSTQNFAMTLSMLIIGLVATILNIIYLFAFERLLFSNATRVSISPCEICSQWRYVC